MRVSGTIVYLSTTGTKNEYLHIVVTLAGHEVEAIDEIYFNDELVPLTGGVPDAGTLYDGVARINKKRGVPGDTADADLIADTASLTDGKWTADHKLSGIAYLYVRLTWDAEKFPSGIPNISAVIRGKKVLDPRTNTTAYSANAALCLRDYLTDTSLGMAMASAEIDDTAFTAAANICDEDVEIKPVTVPATYENRYEANGVVSTSASPDENIGKLLSAMGGLMAYSGGKIVPYAAAYRIPTITFDEKHFVGPISVQTRTSARDRVNSVKGVYVSEDNDWQVTDFPTITDANYVSADNNTKFFRDVVLPFTTSPSCAQRLAVVELRRAREEITMTARFRLEAMQVRAGDTVMITNAKLGFSSKVFEVMDWHFASGGTPPEVFVDMTLRETDSSVYSWNVTDEIFVAGALNTTLPNPFALSAPTNLTLTADGTTQLMQVDGTALPRIKVAWTAPSEEFIQSGGDVVIEYKEGVSTTYLTWSRVDGSQTSDFISSDVKIGLTYDVRIYGLSYFDISTTYVTASVTVVKDATAPNTPTNGTITAEGVKPKFIPNTQVFLVGTRVGWSPNTQSDFSHYEIKATTTDSDAATNYSWTPYDGNFFVTTSDTETFLYNATFSAGYVRVRAVNRSGTPSAWLRIGNANDVGNSSIGTGDVARYDDDDVETTGIKTGDGASTLQVNVVYETNEVVNITGGGTSTTVGVGISGKGFSTKPDDGIVVVEDVLYAAFYDSQDAGSTSATAVVKIFRNDGDTLDSGDLRLSARFTAYT